MKFNTALATLMALTNSFYQRESLHPQELKVLLQLLNPVAPHITEEIWERVGFEGHIHSQPWPRAMEEKFIETTMEIILQVNGKLKGKVVLPADTPQEAVRQRVMEAQEIKEALGKGKLVKEIYVPGKIYNLVIQS